MKRQRGISLVSTLILGVVAMAVLIFCFKLVPVYNEFFSVKKAFATVLTQTDSSAAPTAYRTAFARFKEVGGMESVDPALISVSKDNGQVTLEVSYRREMPLFSGIGMYFDFNVKASK